MGKTRWVTWFDVNEYPDTDGKPIAENTLQYDWITKIKDNLEIVFIDDPNVFVAADLFWYPVEGNNTIRRGPDAMVAFGRPKGPRLAYLQWLEGGIAPQVVFEVLSPSNRGVELAHKFRFYETYGVEEYYIYDPDDNTLEGWIRGKRTLRKISAMNGWISPRLDVRFEQAENECRLYGPDGRLFLGFVELLRQAEQEEEELRRTDYYQWQFDENRRRAEEYTRRAEEWGRRVERLAAQLKSLGIEPEP